MPENVELIYRGYEAWNRRDLEGTLELMDAEIEWRFSDAEMTLPGGALVYHGHEGVRRFWAELMEPLPELHIEVERTLEKDDHVVAFVRFQAAGIDQPSAHVFRFRGGKVFEFTAYNDRDRALEAAGLGE